VQLRGIVQGQRAASVDRSSSSTAEGHLASVFIPEELDAVLPTGETLLQLAVEARYPAFLRWLLEAGADPNRVNAAGDTPLIVSCRGDFAVETGILLEFGADPNYRTPGGWTALRCAAKDRNYAAVRILLAKGATIPETNLDEPWASSLDSFAHAVAEE
jgi:ankyrin repeat protein